jgi:hypothetical protein
MDGWMYAPCGASPRSLYAASIILYVYIDVYTWHMHAKERDGGRQAAAAERSSSLVQY